MGFSPYAGSTGTPTLAWAQSIKALELKGLAPGEPLADAMLSARKLVQAEFDKLPKGVRGVPVYVSETGEFWPEPSMADL